jgi:hypothetical protein
MAAASLPPVILRRLSASMSSANDLIRGLREKIRPSAETEPDSGVVFVTDKKLHNEWRMNNGEKLRAERLGMKRHLHGISLPTFDGKAAATQRREKKSRDKTNRLLRRRRKSL